VRVLLPARLEPAASEPPPSHRPRWRGNRTVLVVDDDPAVRRVIAGTLRRQGYAVLEAGDGESALQRFLGHPDGVGLVICDVDLRGETCLDVFLTLERRRPGLKGMFVPGHAAADLARGSILAAHPFIEKPFSVEALARSVDGI